MLLSQLIAQVEANEDLSQEAAHWLMGQMMQGNLPTEDVKKIILGLKNKGESLSEVTGFVDAMLERASAVNFPGVALDIVGTGGDQLGTANISSTAAIIAAAAGATVIKHGNRAASSKSGSADVLEALGIKLALSAKEIELCVQEVGIGFCFAPHFHPAMKNVAQVRKELGVPTIFNILGPLANPARPSAMALGVADPNRALLMAGVLQKQGCVGFVAHGSDGLDEITTTGTSTIWEFGKQNNQFELYPADFGIPIYAANLLTGGDAKENAQLLLQVIDPDQNAIKVEALRAAAVLNSAAGLIAFWIKSNQIHSVPTKKEWQKAIDASYLAIKSGAAKERLTRWQEFCATI